MQITSSRSLIYSRKSVGPSMQPSGTPVLTEYFCENFPSRTTRSHRLVKKEEIRPNIWPEIPYDLSLWRRPACQPCQKPWIYQVPHSSSLRPFKSNSIWHNCPKICSWSRRPKTILKIRKKATFLKVISNPIIYKFFKDFTNHRKKTNKAVVFSQKQSSSFTEHFLTLGIWLNSLCSNHHHLKIKILIKHLASYLCCHCWLSYGKSSTWSNDIQFKTW